LSDLRFRQANLLKKILGSNVEFQQRDILGDELNEQFDVVLLLNVIHHLPEPMSALRKGRIDLPKPSCPRVSDVR
jgi:2-polyprenyl-3-methyl-5-hydroxy-6-metoxy-1,4-benzoquinol methylase